MIRKLLMILFFIFVLAFIADYYGFITLPSFKKAKTLDTRDHFIQKTDKSLKELSD